MLDLAVLPPGFLVTGLEETAAAAAAEVVGFIRGHLNKIFFAHSRFDHKADVISRRIPVAFPDNLAGILYGEFDLKVFVPIRVDLQTAFPDPFGVILINGGNFKVALVDFVFSQSFQDCKGDVPSFGVEVRFAPQLLCLVD